MLALIAALSVTLTPGATTFALGDEIPFTFVITNTGTASYDYIERSYDHSGRLGEFRLIATRSDGVPLADPRTGHAPYMEGGLGTPGTLAPGASFKQTIALNLWALMEAPGTYTVIGRFHFNLGYADSPPVTIVVTPRSTEAMGRYVRQLGAALAAAETREDREHALQKLMFTRDERAVPFVLDASTKGSSEAFWIEEAFASYLPKTPAVRDQAVAHLRKTGLATLSVRPLTDLGVPADQITPIIAAALAPAHRDEWLNGALGAQRYGDDRFMPRLIAIASLEGEPARMFAISAVAMNRTDAGVAFLKRLLADPDQGIREHTAAVIRDAYHQRGGATGRPLRPDDFPDLAR